MLSANASVTRKAQSRGLIFNLFQAVLLLLMSI